MRRYGARKLIQLNSGTGANSITVTPTTSTQSLSPFQLSSIKANDMITGTSFRYATRLVVQIAGTITQPGAGSGVNALTFDALSNVVSQIQVDTPILGTLRVSSHNRGVDIGGFDAWITNGYQPKELARSSMAVTSADYTFLKQFSIGLGEIGAFGRTTDFSMWAGLLEGGTVTVILNSTTGSVSGASTGAVLKATSTVIKCWLEVVESPDVELWTPTVWQNFTSTAPSSTTSVKCTAVDAILGLKGIKQPALPRIIALAHMSSNAIFAFGGSGSIANVTQFSCPQVSQEVLNDPGFMVSAFIQQLGLPIGYTGTGSGTTLGDGNYGFLYDMTQGNLSTTYLTGNLGFLPIVMPSYGQQQTKEIRFAGDLTYNITQSSTSGQHYTRGVTGHDLDPAFQEEMFARMGRPGYVAVPKQMDGAGLSGLTGKSPAGIPLMGIAPGSSPPNRTATY